MSLDTRSHGPASVFVMTTGTPASQMFSATKVSGQTEETLLRGLVPKYLCSVLYNRTDDVNDPAWKQGNGPVVSVLTGRAAAIEQG